jgi:hypothetical protein
LTNRSAVRGYGAAVRSDRTPQLEEVPDELVEDIERWLIDRGVPHLVDQYDGSVLLGAWTRSIPLLAGAAVLLGLNALDLRSWSVAENLAAAAAIVAILGATWAVSNRLRRKPLFAPPSEIGAPEIAVLLIGPTLPAIAFGQYRDALETFGFAVVVLTVVYVWSSYGVGALLRWGLRRSEGQLTGLGPLVARALPLLLLFTTFLFVNAEVWEMAGTLDGAAYVVVVLMFFLLGAGFVMIRVPGVIAAANEFDDWADVEHDVVDTPAEAVPLPRHGRPVDPLTLRQRLNLGLIVVFGQALQITLVVMAIVAFFVFFGFMAIGEATILGWTGLDSLDPFAEVSFGDRTLVLSEPLIRVAIFLGAFSGMYFTVLLTTDETYRREFTEDVGDDIRQLLAVRCAYRVARGTAPAAGGDEAAAGATGTVLDDESDHEPGDDPER